ncbi:Mur ligase family protein, partial [Ideonella sp. B508-1]|uniref:Mur ligase family protein n=1 Tax=Ideonella sp. B508-1 TaxID=137716 RepID=UPI0003B5D69F
MKHLQDLSVLILGLGDSGLAMARWCARHGAARIRVWDSRANPPQAAALAAEVPAAIFFSGALSADTLEDARLLLKSPGLSPAKPELQSLLAAAQAVGVPVGGELGLYARSLADLKADWGYAPKVLAITGTNGKTTTTSLTAQLVERCDRRVAVAGNIGPTLLDTLTTAWLAEAEARALAAEQAQAEAEAAAAEAEAAVHAPQVDSTSVEIAPAPSQADELPVASDAAAEAPEAEDGTDEPAAVDAAPLDNEPAPVVLAPPPPAEPVFEHLPQVWVLELLSFRLDGV